MRQACDGAREIRRPASIQWPRASAYVFRNGVARTSERSRAKSRCKRNSPCVAPRRGIRNVVSVRATYVPIVGRTGTIRARPSRNFITRESRRARASAALQARINPSINRRRMLRACAENAWWGVRITPWRKYRQSVATMPARARQSLKLLHREYM